MVYVKPGLEAAEQSIKTAGVGDFDATEACTKMLMLMMSSVDIISLVDYVLMRLLHLSRLGCCSSMASIFILNLESSTKIKKHLYFLIEVKTTMSRLHLI